MYPILLELGKIKLHTYGLMIAIGVITAIVLAQRDARKRGLDPGIISEMGFWIVVLGIIGTRLLYIIMFPEGFSWSDPIGWIAIWRGGLVFQGAILPAFLYILFELRRRKISFWLFSDILVPWIPLAQAFGRIGCLMFGCCYGARTEVPWAIRFPAGSPAFHAHLLKCPELSSNAAWSLPVHPTQLYSVAGLLLICAILLYARKKWPQISGLSFSLYLMLYGVMRFIVEIYRGDGNPTIWIFSNQQLFSLSELVIGLGIMIFLIRRKSQPKVESN